MDELKREYRKAAEQAVRQGDFRRAAYIYGKLLGDDRTAAQALQRGGLHQDAATIYLRKVNDRAEAARAFEAAGHIDRAIALYRELGQHEAAGDLLRRIGDDEAAVREYQRAAFVAATSMPGDHYHAGLVLLNKAGMPEPAIEHFRLGWVHRPAANAAACALELTLIHATRGEIEPIRNLLDEADAFFKSAGSARDAEGFYNRTAVIASAAPALASSAEEVRDRASWRCRTTCAGRSRPGVRPARRPPHSSASPRSGRRRSSAMRSSPPRPWPGRRAIGPRRTPASPSPPVSRSAAGPSGPLARPRPRPSCSSVSPTARSWPSEPDATRSSGWGRSPAESPRSSPSPTARSSSRSTGTNTDPSSPAS